MKKFLAATLVAIMMVTLAAGALAQGRVSLEQAKQIALKRAGVTANEVRFNKANQDWDDGRMIWEIEFYCDGIEYNFDVDMMTGRILEADQEREYYSDRNGRGSRGWDDDWNDDWDRDWDRDWDDWFDFD